MVRITIRSDIMMTYYLTRDLVEVTVILGEVIDPCPHEVLCEKHRKFRGRQES